MSGGRRRALAAGLGTTSLAAAVFVAMLGDPAGRADGRPDDEEVAGRVIALDGSPVQGALVRAESSSVRSGPDGSFHLPLRGGQWITAEADGFLPRTRPLSARSGVLLRLTPDDGRTVRLRFGGDVMSGRRFFDPNEDGDLADGLISPTDDVARHAGLLAGVEPLLRQADISFVTLETPLAADPYADPRLPRPSRFHPQKDFAFASSPSLAGALRRVGVDVVSVGNNHFFDLLGKGARSTLSALSEAGFDAGSGRFGAGLNEREAWEPAVMRRKGQSFAFVGCTTISRPISERVGPDDVPAAEWLRLSAARRRPPIPYTAGPRRSGAARCEARRLARRVSALSRRHDVVVVVIHGGFEYVSSPSESVRRLTDVAVRAGATLVVNSHPHVAGALARRGKAVVAWTLGNLLFDQEIWPTFQSYLLTVDIRDGQIVRAFADPLVLDGFKPRAATGMLADRTARLAAADGGPVALEDGVAELAMSSPPASRRSTVRVRGDLAGTVVGLRQGTVIVDKGPGVRLGRDLIWTGSFEPETVGGSDTLPTLWHVSPAGGRVVAEAAFAGDRGVRLTGMAGGATDAILTTRHRILLRRHLHGSTLLVPGTELSLVGRVKTRGVARLKVQLSWYDDTRGASYAQQLFLLPSTETWQPFRVDVRVPRRAVAVGVFFRLGASKSGRHYADLDDIRLVSWAPAETPPSPLFDHALVRGPARLVLATPTLPGAGDAAGEPGYDTLGE